MLSSNNKQEQFRKQEPKRQRFAIKKLTVGVASVLIGFTFMGLNASASADEVPSQPADDNDNNAQSQAVTNLQSANVSLINQSSAQANSASTKAQMNVAPAMPVADAYQRAVASSVAAQNSSASASANVSSAPAQSAEAVENVDTNLNSTALTNTASANNLAALYGTSLVAVQPKESDPFTLPAKTAENTVQVSNYKDFSAALINKNIHYIELQGSGLTFDDDVVKNDQSSINNGGVGAEGISSRHAIPHYEIALNKALSSQYDNIGRDVVIEGQGQDKTTLDMGKWYFSFWDANNKNGNHPWNITLKNMTFKTDAAQYKLPSSRAPFIFNGKSADGSSVNLVNVNADFGKRGAGLVNSNDKVAANIKNSTVTATGTVIKNGQNAVLDGVTANISNGSLVYTSGNLIVKGQNSVIDDLKSKSNDAFIAKNVNIDDNAVLDLNITNSAVGETDADIDLAGKNNNVFYIGSKNVKTANLENPSDNGNFTVGKNAKITLNSANVTKDKDGSILSTQKGLHNLRFMYNVNAQGGNFVVNSGANVDLNMGTGHSVAIWAGNMAIAPDAVVNIATLQNNNEGKSVGAGATVTYNGFHYGVVSLGVLDTQIGDIDLSGKNSNDAEINGILKITRGKKSEDIKTIAPLISFGSGSTNEKQTFTFNVNKGGTLDLRDSSNSAYDNDTVGSPIPWMPSMNWIGEKGNVNRIGLITMWGTGATNNITFNAPQYINLQRRGSQIGSSLRTEGLHNHIIAKDDATKGTPLAQWMGQNQSETPDEAWRIQNLDAQVAGGNFFSNFLPAGAHAGEKGGQFFDGSGYLKDKYFGTPFDKSQGTAQMAPFMGNYKFENGSYTGDSMAGVHGIGLTQLTNDFTWWSPRRITFGENGIIKINDATNYEPETQAINKTTKDNVKTLTKSDLQDGIKDLLGADDKVAQDHATILGDSSLINWDDSSWGLDWSKTQFKDGLKTDVTKLTTAQLNIFNVLKKIAAVTPATDKSGNFIAKTSTPQDFNGQVATIVYNDSTAEHPSVDFVLVPVNVTEHHTADDYTPAYKAVDVQQGKTATVNPTFTDDKGSAQAPAGTKYVAGEGTPSWAKVNETTGAITYAPSTDVKVGPYNVPVTVTYADGSVDKVNAPVFVTDANETVTWGDNGAVVVTANPAAMNAHETSDHSQVFNAAAAVSSIEKYAIDKTTGKIAATGTAVAKDDNGVKISWTTTPDTTVATATAAGKVTSGVLAVELGNNADDVLGNAAKTVSANVNNIDAKGAGAKNVAAPVNVQLGTDLSNDQFEALVDNNIPAGEIAKTAWKVAPQKGHDAVIEITFNDTYAAGQPTYLDINIPAKNINVTDDSQENDPQTTPISTPQGVVPSAPSAITNQDKMPQGTTYTWTNQSTVNDDANKPGVHTEQITVTYPDKTTDTVTTEMTVDATPTTNAITTEVGKNPAAAEGITNLKNNVPGYPASAEWKTAPDTSKVGPTTGEITAHYPDGTTQTVTVPVMVNDDQNINIIDDQGHTYSLHVENVISHKTSDKNLIGNPVVDTFKLSYYEGGQNYSKPFIYTLDKDGNYKLTQKGDVPEGQTVNAPETVAANEVSSIWTPTGDFNDQIPGVQGNGQPTTIASTTNNGTATIVYDNNQNTQGKDGYVYPMYPVTVDTSKVNWPIFGKGPKASHPFPFVTIYGATANGKKTSIYSNTKDVKTDLGDASSYINDHDLTENGFTPTSIDWENLPSLDKANANAQATIKLNFKDGSNLVIPVTVNVIDVDDGNTDKTNRDVYRDITRTINVQGAKPVTQHVVYSRAKLTDLSKPAGQQVSYTDWKAAVNEQGQQVTIFPAVEVTKPGYNATATGATIETKGDKQFVPASAKITPDSANQVVNVTYTANEHTLTITYVDKDTGKQVGAAYTVKGATGENEKLDVAGHVPANWQLVAGQQVLSTYEFGSKDPAPVSYKVEHKTENVSVDKNNKDTYREVSQTIIETIPGQQPKTVRNTTVPFQRTGVKDLVTNQITWNAWQAPKGGNADGAYTIDAYNFDGVKGYDTQINGQKAAKNEIPTVTVNADSQNITDNITFVKQGNTPVPFDPSSKDMYKSVTRTITINDPNGAYNKTQTVNFSREDKDGNAGYTDPTTGETTWNAWHVANSTETNGKWAEFAAPTVKGYTADPAKVAQATVTPDTKDVTITINYTKQGNTPVPFDPTNDNMYREVIRTITINKPSQAEPDTETQTVKFTREDAQGNAGYTDPVSGKTTMNAWHVVGSDATTGTWAEFDAPSIDGYTADPAKVAQVTVTPDTQAANVTINYTKNAPKQSDADKYTPSYPEVVTTPGTTESIDVQYDGDKPAGNVVYEIAKGANVPSWVSVDKNSGKITYTIPADASTQVVNVPVTITYADGSQDKTNSVAVIVAGKDHVDNPGGPKDVIKNPENLPTGTTVVWTPGEQPDPNKKGDQPANVTVTVPGQDPITIPTTVNYGNPTDADEYTPEGKDVTTVEGKTPAASEGIANMNELPAGTTATWTDANKIANDVKNRGDYTETITVTYPEGSKDTVEIHLTVTAVPVNPKPAEPDADKYTPEGQDVTTKEGQVPSAAEGIKNKSDLPSDTKYTWTNPDQVAQDIKTAGTHTETITVTYPDGSKDTVDVHVVVTPTDAEKYSPETQPITTPEGQVPNPADGIKNKGDLPAGTKYTWANPDQVAQDVKTAGNHTETIVVTYPDGSSEEVTTTVTVPAPEGQDITTPQGVLPNPSDAIKNKDQMPAGTKYTWKQEPDVTTPGDHTGIVEVTFPDGTTVDVPVNVHVEAPANNNKGDDNDDKKVVAPVTPHAASETTVAAVSVDKTVATAAPNNASQPSAKKLPQTGNNNSETAAVIGLGIASLASLFGMGGMKKRKEDK